MGVRRPLQLNTPVAVAVTADGGYLITDQGNSSVRRVSAAGVITTAATGLNVPNGVAATADGGFLVADSNGHRVLRVAPDGTVTPVAGTGAFGYDGDDGPATAARSTSQPVWRPPRTAAS